MVTLDQAGAGRRELEIRAPEEVLRDLVELSWIQRPSRDHDSAAWRIVPDEAPHLLHHRFRDGRTRTSVVGGRSRYLDIRRSDREATVGIRLRPGALRTLFDVDAWELRDRGAPVAEVAGQAGRDLAEVLEGERDPRAAERILGDFVTRVAAERDRDWRVRGFVVLTARHDMTVRAASDALGVSERSLRDVCRSDVGLRPKEVQRVRRLHRAIALGLSGEADAEVALRVGYADQAHMIRESRALLGATPAEFRARGRAVSSKTKRIATA